MIIRIILLLFALCSVARAADNAVVLTPGAGVTMRTKDVGAGIQSSFTITGDISGNAIYGTAGVPNANTVTVQGIISGTPINANVSNANANGQATMANSSPVVISSNQSTISMDIVQIGTNNPIDVNSGVKSNGTQRIVVATDQPQLTNARLVQNLGTSAVNTITASTSAQSLSNVSGGGTGATGDYLSHCVVFPITTSPGIVTILDNSTAVFSFPGGSSSVSNLAPFSIPVGSKSVSGSWKVTTGANVGVSCSGKFS